MADLYAQAWRGDLRGWSHHCPGGAGTSDKTRQYHEAVRPEASGFGTQWGCGARQPAVLPADRATPPAAPRTPRPTAPGIGVAGPRGRPSRSCADGRGRVRAQCVRVALVSDVLSWPKSASAQQSGSPVHGHHTKEGGENKDMRASQACRHDARVAGKRCDEGRRAVHRHAYLWIVIQHGGGPGPHRQACTIHMH